MRADSPLTHVCVGGGAREHMRAARVSLERIRIERVHDLRVGLCACTSEAFTTFKHIAADLIQRRAPLQCCERIARLLQLGSSP